MVRVANWPLETLPWGSWRLARPRPHERLRPPAEGELDGMELEDEKMVIRKWLQRVGKAGGEELEIRKWRGIVCRETSVQEMS